jgi:hypothetical protein
VVPRHRQSHSAAASDSVKVLCISGLHRTGSTILANVLGEIEGFFSAGEFVYFWQAIASRETCTCGALLPECPVWGPILHSLFAGPEEAVQRLRPDPPLLQTRHIPLLLFPEPRTSERLERYRQTLADLCRAIRATTGARVIIETSKRPMYAWLLAGAPGLDVYVVHLVRDPRATAYSWLRAGLSDQWSAGPFEVGATWTTWHWTITRMWRRRPGRYLPLRYEDFVREPRQAVLDILALMGESASDLPFVDDHTVRLGPSHMAQGNPNRFRHGLVELKVDDAWRSRLARRQVLAATATALPLLRRWGYPLRV